MGARPLVLLTDYGATDFYAGVTRAVIAAGSPTSRVIDLQHDLPAHDIAAASFVLARSFDYLPTDAVVVVVVDPGVGTERRGLVVTIANRVLVGPDNGFASDLVCAAGDRAVFLAIDETAALPAIGGSLRGATFHGRDIFAPVAAAIARGEPPQRFAAAVDGIHMLSDVPSVSVDGGHVKATGRYVDHFGNILSDMPLAVVRRVIGDESRARVRVNGRDVGPLRRTYADSKPGELMALVNSWELVEVAMNSGRAIDYLEGAPARSLRIEVSAGDHP